MKMTATVKYCGRPAHVACDGLCSKAWGFNSRPRVYLASEEEDPDDYALLSDDELGVAPSDPGTYEGGDPKPEGPDQFPTRWCVRECERCVMSAPGKGPETIKVPDFSMRLYNIPSHAPTVKP